MAKKRRMRKLAAMEAAKTRNSQKIEDKQVVEVAPEPVSEPVVVSTKEVEAEEKPKKTRRLWSRKSSTEE